MQDLLLSEVLQDETMVSIQRRGVLLVLSSPSGGGKSTLANALLKETQLIRSISVTTRLPRGTEKDGEDYYFFSIEKFEDYRNRGAFIEWAKVHDNYYGTLIATVENALESGKDIIFNIDYQGVVQLQQKLREDVVSVFILPPSMKELKKRLEQRAEDSPQVIERRLKNAREELSYWSIYDYVLVNDCFETCLAKLKMIYSVECLKRKRNFGLQDRVSQLCMDDFSITGDIYKE